MADVFISYASGDRERAHKMASALEARGLSVWWDRKLIVGQSYDQVIEQELEIARSVVVLWSKDAVLSEWVKNEAAVAAERGILVPALIDDIKLPLEFRRRQTANLVNWNGDPSHSGFLALCDGIALKAADAGTALPRQAGRPASSGFRLTRPLILSAVAVLAIASAAGVYWGLMRETQPSVSNEVGTVSNEVKTSGVTESVETADIADSVAGTYYGDVVADSQGGSRTDVTVTITRVGKRRVRVTSDYERLGEVEVELSKAGNVIQSSGGEATLSLDMDTTPPRLAYNPGGVVYAGQKR